MEIKLTVSIGATLQVRNAKGEWDWIKPDVGAEISIPNPTQETDLQQTFADLWDNIVGPQFKNVVDSLIADQIAAEEETGSEEEQTDDTPVSDDEEYD